MKKKIFLGLVLAIGIVLFIGTINQIGVNTIIDTLARFQLVSFLVFFLISLVNFLIYTFRWKVLINIEGFDVPLGKLTLHSFAGFMMSYLTPATLLSGEPIRIYLLKKDNNIPAKEGAVSVITDKAVEITSVLLFITIGIILAISEGLVGKDNLYAMLITVVVVSGCIALFYSLIMSQRGFFRSIFRSLQLHRIKKLQPLEEKIIHTESKIAHFFRHHKKVFLMTLLLASLCWLIKVVEVWIVLYFLGVSLSISQLFILTFLPMIALLMPIPGGLGILEGGTAAVMGLMGVNPQYAVSLVLITRIRDIIFVTVGLIHTSHHSLKRLLHNLRNISTMNGKEKS